MVQLNDSLEMEFLILDDPLSAVLRNSIHSPLLERLLLFGHSILCT